MSDESLLNCLVAHQIKRLLQEGAMQFHAHVSVSPVSEKGTFFEQQE